LNTIAFLDKRLDDFNNKTIIELAHIAKNKHFIAHSVCQKWLNRRWAGNLLIKKLDTFIQESYCIQIRILVAVLQQFYCHFTKFSEKNNQINKKIYENIFFISTMENFYFNFQSSIINELQMFIF
jgi:hypothetical protein